MHVSFISLRDFVHSGYCDPKRRRLSCVGCRVSFVGAINRVTRQNLRSLVGIDLLFFSKVAYN